MSDDVILKTSFRGFDRKEVMDYIETLQKENRELKKRIAELEGNPLPEEPNEAAESEETPVEPLEKIQNVNLLNPMEEEEAEFEPEVAAAMSKADDAIAKADESIVLNDVKDNDVVTAIYNAVLEAVSNSEEIQLELEDAKKDPEEKTEPVNLEKPNSSGSSKAEESPKKTPVKVKVKIRPKKGN